MLSNPSGKCQFHILVATYVVIPSAVGNGRGGSPAD